jgi:cytochrome c553
MPVYNETLGTTVFSPVTSEHEFRGSSWGAFGGGDFGKGNHSGFPLPDGQLSGAQAGESVQIKMDCATCHDPHGSANYRILKAQVNGNDVGGYGPGGTPVDPDPDGWVSSMEEGWPVGGPRLHQAYPDYKPNYTEAKYAKGRATVSGRAEAETGMSGWCAGCHQTYLLPAQTVTKADGTEYDTSGNVYNAGDGSGLKMRHRHPINVPLSNFKGQMDLVLDSGLPLAHTIDAVDGNTTGDTNGNESSDWIECLTCHRAHGTAAVMEGYAADGSLPVDVDGVPRNNFPGDPSALLRMDNRGVCEACHNK